MVGIARKNENSAAERLSVPSSSAPTIVAPDRDTPGIIAKHWQTPIASAIRGGKSIASWYFGLSGNRSTMSRMMPPMISVEQISNGLSNSTVLMKSCASTPITTAGRNASNTAMTNRRARGSVGNETAIRQSLAE